MSDWSASQTGSDEREFLHDIATSIATASLAIDIVTDVLQNLPDADVDLVQHLLLAGNALGDVRDQLHARRQILTERGVSGARDE